MIVSSECICNNIKLSQTCNIVGNTPNEYEEKYGYNYHRVVEVMCLSEFFYNLKNGTKNIIINSYNIIGELNKIKQSSRRMIKLIKVIQVKNIIKGKINNIILDIYFKSGCMTILWRKIYVKVVNESDNQDCCEKHYCHFNK